MTTGTVDAVSAVVEAHASAAREHLEEELAQRAVIERDVAFAIMVTRSGAGR